MGPGKLYNFALELDEKKISSSKLKTCKYKTDNIRARNSFRLFFRLLIPFLLTVDCVLPSIGHCCCWLPAEHSCGLLLANLVSQILFRKLSDECNNLGRHAYCSQADFSVIYLQNLEQLKQFP